MIFEFSKEDLLQSRVVTPGWYRVLITDVFQKPSSGDNPQTKNIYPIAGHILFNADNGDKEFEGVPTPPSWNFNDNPNAKGFVAGFFSALEGNAIEPGRRTLKAAEGKQIDVFIENDTYQGRVVNRINHKYRTPKEGVA